MSFIKKIRRGDKTYLAEVESKRVNGKVVQKYLRYIGKEVDGEKVISLNSKDLQIDRVRISGPLLVLDFIAKKINLHEIFGNYGNEILSMVYAHCLNYKSVNNMPEWFERTDLNKILNLEGLTEARLLSGLDKLNRESVENYQTNIFENVKNAYKLSTRGLVYDVTNTYFHGKKCPIGKKGKSKDGKRQNPLMQVGLAVTRKEGIPIFHKIFDGNIHDSRTLESFAESLSIRGLRSGMLVYDRGIISSKNLVSIGEKGWDTLCGLPVKEAEKNEIRKILRQGGLVDVSNRVLLSSSIVYAKSVDYQYGKINGKMTICYNPKKKDAIREARYDEIVKTQKNFSKRKKSGISKYLTPTGRVRKKELKKAEEFDGYSCIFSTSESLSCKETVIVYFDKDIVEKAFKILKGVVSLNPVRHWLHDRVVAHVFICYLSYLLLSLLKYELRDLEITPVQALKNLESMYKIYFSDKKKKYKMSKTVTLSKYQESILKALDKRLLKDSREGV